METTKEIRAAKEIREHKQLRHRAQEPGWDYNNNIETAEYLRQRIADAGKPMPNVTIILGSGLGKLADHIEEPLVIPYGEIPYFPQSTAIGHKGNLIVGTLGGKTVMAMQGRFHYYEGYTMEQVTFPERVFARMGVKTLFVSNAAGAVNPTCRQHR